MKRVRKIQPRMAVSYSQPIGKLAIYRPIPSAGDTVILDHDLRGSTIARKLFGNGVNNVVLGATSDVKTNKDFLIVINIPIKSRCIRSVLSFGSRIKAKTTRIDAVSQS